MKRGIISISLGLALVISMASISAGFENNKENYDKNAKDFIEYNQQNIEDGRLKGGHDTITSEAAKLKKEVHNDNQDFKTWIDEQALPSFRTGAHDEDALP